MQILDHRQIQQKIVRLAYEMVERNFGHPEIILAGLNNNGFGFAELIHQQLLPILPEEMKVRLTRIRLNPANPLEYEPTIDLPGETLKNCHIIVVDDVANTGRTIFYAIQPLLHALPQKVEVAVLVDRKHKSFPIKADYVGMSLYTTLKDDIDVQIRDQNNMAVYLK